MSFASGMDQIRIDLKKIYLSDSGNIVPYDDSESRLPATNIQDAINAIDTPDECRCCGAPGEAYTCSYCGVRMPGGHSGLLDL